MPWEVKKSDSCPAEKPFGLFNKITGRKVACHASEISARKHQKALYANVPESRMSELVMIARPISFAEFENDLLWIEALPAKTWHTKMWGEVVITPAKLNNMIRNLKSNVRDQQIATNFEHGLDKAKGSKASGWIKDAKVKDNSLYIGFAPTPTAKEEILNHEWKYFSLEWEDFWQHPETQQLHEDVIVGGALTNVPVAKGLMPINFSELFDEKEQGGKVEETKETKVETTETKTTGEHADVEHAEPGETDSPDPDTNKDDSEGSRHETVPGNNDDDNTTSNSKEKDMENKELDKQLREKLGLAEDADIIKAVDDLKEEVGPLREVAKKFSETKKFSEQFPEQAAELERLQRERIEGEAIKFSETVGEMRFGADKKHQFAPVVLEKVANMHKKFSESTATQTDFEDLIKSLHDDKALVEVGERGSGRNEEIKFSESGNSRMAFSEAVKSIMEEDKIEYDQAIKLASEKFPELAKAYSR